MHACSRLQRRICAAVFLQPPVRQRQPLLLGLCTCVDAVLYGAKPTASAESVVQALSPRLLHHSILRLTPWHPHASSHVQFTRSHHKQAITGLARPRPCEQYFRYLTFSPLRESKLGRWRCSWPAGRPLDRVSTCTWCGRGNLHACLRTNNDDQTSALARAKGDDLTHNTTLPSAPSLNIPLLPTTQNPVLL